MNRFVEEKLLKISSINPRLQKAYLWCVMYELKNKRKEVKKYGEKNISK